MPKRFDEDSFRKMVINAVDRGRKCDMDWSKDPDGVDHTPKSLRTSSVSFRDMVAPVVRVNSPKVTISDTSHAKRDEPVVVTFQPTDEGVEFGTW